MRPHRRVANRARTLAALLTIALGAAACADTSTPLSSREQDVQSTSDDVDFTECGSVCTGTIDGAKYSIKLPGKWNGTLLLYSHGYRFAQPGPPDYEPVRTSAQVTTTDPDGSGSDPLSTKLLADGYALAGSSYKSNGWAVADGVSAGEALYDRFTKVVGKPKRTYVWGDSLGGLITEILAEKDTSFVDGAAPMCGAVAGPNLNFDSALDVAFATKALIDPGFKIIGYASADEANAMWKQASDKIIAAAGDTAGGGTAKVLFLSALVNAPSKTRTYDGHDLVSQVKATVDAMLTALAFGTLGRYEVEQRVGGNPSGNTGTDYATRISDAEAQLIKTAGGDSAALAAQVNAAPRVQADARARAAFEKLGDTTGDIHVPTVTMHTEQDPLVLVSNESVLASRAAARKAAGDLVQLYIAPPATYSESTRAPYGAGHCIFSDQQREGLITTLDSWTRRSVYPVPAGIGATIGAGLDPTFTPLPWPTKG